MRIFDVLLNIRQSRLFELSVAALIVVSAVTVGVHSYDLDSATIHLLQRLDYVITLIFIAELLLRFVTEPSGKRLRSFFGSGWNVFDLIIVSLSLIPIPENDTYIVFRLLRVFRLMRIITLIPDLKLLVNSFFRSLPKIGYLALLIFIVTYLYAAVGVTLFGSIDPKSWGDIGKALLTLFMIMTLEGWADVMNQASAAYSQAWIYFVSYVVLSSFAFLNLLIGVIVQVVDQEQALGKQQLSEKDSVEEKIERIRGELDALCLLLKNK